MTMTSWNDLGGSDESWDSWRASQASGLLDEEQNIASLVDGNRLLHVPGVVGQLTQKTRERAVTLLMHCVHIPSL